MTARNVDLVAEGYDLALRGGDLRDSSLIVRATLHSEFGLFAAPDYLKRAVRPRRLSDLHDHVCIGVNVAHHRAVWKFSAVTLRLVTPSRDLEPMSVRLFREGLPRERWLRAGSWG